MSKTYKTIPVSEDTFNRIRKIKVNCESWDEVMNRIVDIYDDYRTYEE